MEERGGDGFQRDSLGGSGLLNLALQKFPVTIDTDAILDILGTFSTVVGNSFSFVPLVRGIVQC